MNLVYYIITSRLDEDKRRDFDALLVESMLPPRPKPASSGRQIRPPAWYKGRNGAARSSIEAARQLGLPVGTG